MFCSSCRSYRYGPGKTQHAFDQNVHGNFLNHFFSMIHLLLVLFTCRAPHVSQSQVIWSHVELCYIIWGYFMSIMIMIRIMIWHILCKCNELIVYIKSPHGKAYFLRFWLYTCTCTDWLGPTVYHSFSLQMCCSHIPFALRGSQENHKLWFILLFDEQNGMQRLMGMLPPVFVLWS